MTGGATPGAGATGSAAVSRQPSISTAVSSQISTAVSSQISTAVSSQISTAVSLK